MAAGGVVEIMSRISKDEEDEAILWRKKKKWPALRDSGRWLTRDHGALAAALRRENARGGIRCETAGDDQPGYI
jgi:hypothetical protein